MKETSKPKEKITTKIRTTDTDRKNGVKAENLQIGAVTPGKEKDHTKDKETDQEKEETDQENKKDQDIRVKKMKKHHTGINVTIILVQITTTKVSHTQEITM